MPDFLLEIGCEEIPARMIDGAVRELRERVETSAAARASGAERRGQLAGYSAPVGGDGAGHSVGAAGSN